MINSSVYYSMIVWLEHIVETWESEPFESLTFIDDWGSLKNLR